ncbi:peroxiredoxin [soil metagenome]
MMFKQLTRVTRAMAAPVAGAALALALAFSLSAEAALPVGSVAPRFTSEAALAGKTVPFSLEQSLGKGPTVLYFFPAAFTEGCTIEAHAFAEATEQFNQLGAAVVGVTAGNVERVAEFSRVECRDKFAVVADPGALIAKQYRTQIGSAIGPISSRTSFVIAPDGKILLAYTSDDPYEHIKRTLAAVQAWHKKHG